MAPTGGETDDQQEETDQGGETGDEEATDGGGEQGDWEEEEQDGERDASDGGGDGAEPTDWEKDEEEGLSDEEDAGQDAEEEDWEDEEPPAPPPVRKYPPGPRAVGKPARPSLRYSNRTVMKNYTYSSWSVAQEDFIRKRKHLIRRSCRPLPAKKAPGHRRRRLSQEWKDDWDQQASDEFDDEEEEEDDHAAIREDPVERAKQPRIYCGNRRICLNGKCKCATTNDPADTKCLKRNKALPRWCPGKIFFRLLSGGRGAPDLSNMANFGSCAVVGSSNSLLGSNLGPEIDSHTAIFRFNDAPALKFAKDVGKRTTVRVQNREWCGHAEGPEFCYLYSLNGTNNRGDLRCISKMRRSKCKDIYPSREAIDFVTRYWRTHPPPHGVRVPSFKASAGFFGIVLSMHLCAQVDVYGFDFGVDHYYKKRRLGKREFSQRHSWKAEQMCIKRLKDGNFPNIRVHGGTTKGLGNATAHQRRMLHAAGAGRRGLRDAHGESSLGAGGERDIWDWGDHGSDEAGGAGLGDGWGGDGAFLGPWDGSW